MQALQRQRLPQPHHPPLSILILSSFLIHPSPYRLTLERMFNLHVTWMHSLEYCGQPISQLIGVN